MYFKSTSRVALKPFLIAVAAALPVYAQADVATTASAQITALSYRLIDLNPNDGITPTVTFNNVTHITANYNSDYFLEDSLPIVRDETASYIGLVPETTLNTSLKGASGTASAQGYAVSASLLASETLAHADPSQRDYQGFGLSSDAGLGVNPGMYDDMGNPMSITLSANTALIVTGVANIKGQFDAEAFYAQAATLPGFRNLSMFPWDMVGASVTLSLGTQSYEQDAYGNLIVTTSNSSSATLANSMDNASFDYTKELSAQFANLTDADANVTLGIQANAHVHLMGSLDFTEALPIDPNPPVITPSVPEPGTYLLMGLGLAGIGLARRRARL